MSSDKNAIKKQIEELEAGMNNPSFWQDKRLAQETLKKIGELKAELSGMGKYDSGNAIMTIFSGAGGDDAEDFSAMLFEMYSKYAKRQGWKLNITHQNKNDHGGYRNITCEVVGNPPAGRAYGILKNESGVHRLVRISPFNAKKLRHTSFSLVEVIPKFEKTDESEIEIPPADLEIEFSRSSGPGGQNVNKRETAVRIVHLPTKLSAHSDGERSQEQNRHNALLLLKGKLYRFLEENRKKKEQGMYVSKTAEIEWGNQIRSYVLHPYKLIKDHRTGMEERDIKKVLEEGELDSFIEAEKNL